MGESAPVEWKHMWGAKVKWPSDMPDDMLEDAIKVTREALEGIEDWESQGDAVVDKLKKSFDEKWGPHWHAVVGTNFGSFVTHEARRFVYFYVADKAVLLFKAG